MADKLLCTHTVHTKEINGKSIQLKIEYEIEVSKSLKKYEAIFSADLWDSIFKKWAPTSYQVVLPLNADEIPVDLQQQNSTCTQQQRASPMG